MISKIYFLNEEEFLFTELISNTNKEKRVQKPLIDLIFVFIWSLEKRIFIRIKSGTEV